MSDRITLYESGLVWYCPRCGQSIESAGTDESSRNTVRAFKMRHRHKGEPND